MPDSDMIEVVGRCSVEAVIVKRSKVSRSRGLMSIARELTVKSGVDISRSSLVFLVPGYGSSFWNELLRSRL